MKSATLAKPKEACIPIGTTVRFAVFEGKIVDIEHGAIVARQCKNQNEILHVKYHSPVYIVKRKQVLPDRGYRPATIHTEVRPPNFSRKRQLVRMFADEFQIQN